MSGLLPYILTQLLFGLPYLVGIIVIGAMARGSARVLGAIGCGVLLIGHVLNSVWSIMLPQIVQEFDLPLAMASIPSAIFAVVSGIGMILVICAVVAGRRKQAGPQQQQPGYPSYGQQPGPYQPGPQ
jgi:hypothetical protein